MRRREPGGQGGPRDEDPEQERPAGPPRIVRTAGGRRGGGRRHQRRGRPGPGGRGDRHRGRHGGGDRRGRHRAREEQPARRRRRAAPVQGGLPEDPPQFRLGPRVQHVHDTHRGGRALPFHGLAAATRLRRPHDGLQQHQRRRQQSAPEALPAAAPARVRVRYDSVQTSVGEEGPATFAWKRKHGHRATYPSLIRGRYKYEHMHVISASENI
mmetsp:Transcript_42184/g.82760  ORF Transcript_42184/g.82760 Transcript_42184/m.82760 type:complete len:212 (-) Transcript_42184:25-660(-)